MENKELNQSPDENKDNKSNNEEINLEEFL